jgi:O-antigen/teichoic acid export membrane protein
MAKDYGATGVHLGRGLNAIGGALLISTVGLTGAAIATSTAIVLWNVAMSVFIWRRLGIVPGVWALFQFHGARVRT